MVRLSLDSLIDIDDDRFDIEESFEALDVHKTGRLRYDRAHTLLLGLGYLDDYKKKDSFTLVELTESAKQIENVLMDGDQRENNNNEGLKLETLLTIIATHPALKRRNRRSKSFAQIGFELIDHDRKGYITSSDMQRFGNDVGKNDDDHVEKEATIISTIEANAMIETANRMFKQIEYHDNNNDEENLNINRLVFQKLLGPHSSLNLSQKIKN